MNTNAMLKRQEEIVREMGGISFMQRGSISLQRVARTRGGADTGKKRGPYPLLTWKENGKTRSMRLKTAAEVEWAEGAVANQRRFKALCQEYEALGSQVALGLLEGQGPSAAEALKKGLKSRWSGARK